MKKTYPLNKTLSKEILSSSSKNSWKKIGISKRAGILVPLFCVYSKNSVGIGDFTDLKLLIDFCKKSGNSILQLLPMNEVGSLFCPYDSISSFALEPAYIALNQIHGINKKLINFPAGRPHVDYGIKKLKMELLWEIFIQEINKFPKEMDRFIEENTYWINDFALFRVLKDYHQGRPWYEWEARYKERSILELKVFCDAHEKEIQFQIWLQWQLYKQFKDAREYAKNQKVLIKGDLPIFVSRDSADVWAHSDFFKLEYAAGAPPDMYCAKGQRWGMPTYNWDRISSDNYRYIKERLKYAQNFYDILRIDHVIGLFRIWSIPYEEPLENQGLNGFFDPKDESKWERQGREILSVMVSNTDMLLCAEDLGIIPKVCPKTLKKLGIPGNEVQRWVKDWKIKHDFLTPKDYRFLSVVVLSTHDTTTWIAWWENEAGTVDEELFMRKCADRKIEYSRVKDLLFDKIHSRYGRLRWLNSVSSVDKLVNVLGKKKEEVADFIEMYENTFQEKEKFWRFLGLSPPMREKADTENIYAALKKAFQARSIFCINLILDWLNLDEKLRNVSHSYRINRPGTISENNWSLVIPICLDELLKHKLSFRIKEMLISSGRIAEDIKWKTN